MKKQNKTLTALISLIPEFLTTVFLAWAWAFWQKTWFLIENWFFPEAMIIWFLTISLFFAWVVTLDLTNDKYRKRAYYKERLTSYYKKLNEELETDYKLNEAYIEDLKRNVTDCETMLEKEKSKKLIKKTIKKTK